MRKLDMHYDKDIFPAGLRITNNVLTLDTRHHA